MYVVLCSLTFADREWRKGRGDMAVFLIFLLCVNINTRGEGRNFINYLIALITCRYQLFIFLLYSAASYRWDWVLLGLKEDVNCIVIDYAFLLNFLKTLWILPEAIVRTVSSVKSGSRSGSMPYCLRLCLSTQMISWGWSQCYEPLCQWSCRCWWDPW